MAEIDWERRLRESVDAFNRGDFGAMLDNATDDVTYRRSAASPESRETVEGREALLEYMRPDVFSEQHLEVGEVRLGDAAHVASMTLTATGASSGLAFSATSYLAYFLDPSGEKIARIEVHADLESACAAAGLD